MWSLTPPGYLLAAAIYAGYHSLAALVSPTGPWRVIGRPAAHTLAEALRLVFPFGGVPLATLPIGQADGAFAGPVRVGGVLLLTWVVFQIGFALAGPSPFVPPMARRRWRGQKGAGPVGVRAGRPAPVRAAVGGGGGGGQEGGGAGGAGRRLCVRRPNPRAIRPARPRRPTTACLARHLRARRRAARHTCHQLRSSGGCG